jgi:hypothetical protein
MKKAKQPAAPALPVFHVTVERPATERLTVAVAAENKADAVGKVRAMDKVKGDAGWRIVDRGTATFRADPQPSES